MALCSVYFRVLSAAVICGGAVGVAWAQGAFAVQGSLRVLQSFTDNRDLTQDKRSDAVTQISPGLRLSSRTGAIQGSLDYTLNAQLHAGDSTRNDVANALAAAFNVVAVERHLWFDLRASIAQQAISAYGVQSPTSFSGDPNRGEQRSLALGPRFAAQLGSMADLDGSINWVRTSTGNAAQSDQQSITSALKVSGRLSTMAWSLDMTDVRTDYDLGRDTGNRRVGLSLAYQPHYDWQTSLRLGTETDSVRALSSERTRNWGFGVRWTPTPRTNMDAQFDRRFFGNSYQINFSHRLPRSFWSYSEGRNATGNASADRGLNYATAYDNLFAQLAAQVPDPVLRDQQVRLLLAQDGGFSARSATVDRRRTASMALNGVRTTMTVTAFQTVSQRVDPNASANDDLSLTGRVRQRGYSINASYRLTPTSSLAMGLSSTGTSASVGAPGNNLRSLTASLSSQLAQRVSFSLLVRHAVFDSSVQPYTENGAQAVVGIQF